MRSFTRLALAALFAGACSTGVTASAWADAPAPAEASKGAPVVIAYSAEPTASYTFVNGDESKFRAIHWASDGMVAGVREFTAKGEPWDDVALDVQAHGVPAEGDYGAVVSLTKEEMGYVKFDFDQFRKYYSAGGGFYRDFTGDRNQRYTDKELALDIGKFGVEMGLTLKNIPDILLSYERDYKQGTKSRLSWGSQYSPTVQRKIVPSWMEIDEVSDEFNVKLSDDLFGYHWKAEQLWEYTRAEDVHDVVIYGSTTNTTNTLLDYNQDPRSERIATTLGLDKWFMKEKVYASAGYRFSQITSHELLSMVARLSSSGGIYAGSTNYLPSYSDNLYVMQTGVASVMSTLWDPLTVIARFKKETAHRNGDSTWRQDSSTAPAFPDGIPNTNVVTSNQEKLTSYGESVSLRYSGFPRVSLYNDWEFQQIRSNLSDFRESSNTSPTSSDRFTMQRLDHLYRGSGTLGAQFVPWNPLTLTLQGRYRKDDNRYNNRLYTWPSNITVPGTLPPNWLSQEWTNTSEATARATWKASRWFQPSFRYQLVDKTHRAQGFPDADETIKTTLLSNVYTADLVSNPVDDLLMTASVSYQDGKLMTPARYTEYAPTWNIPTFDYDSVTALFVLEYALNKDLVLTGTTGYTRSTNFDDFSSLGLPLGADFIQTDVTVGLDWRVNKDMTVKPTYAVYRYDEGGAEVGGYFAQMIMLEVKAQWG